MQTKGKKSTSATIIAFCISWQKGCGRLNKDSGPHINEGPSEPAKNWTKQ